MSNPILILTIRGVEIESVEVPLDLKEHPLFSQREAFVNDFRNYLKWKYRIDLMLTCDWTIDMVVRSKMEYFKEEEYETENISINA
jgi:hypothetical protein